MATDFLGSCLFNVLGAGCTILILTAFPIAQITIGALHLHACPVAPLIPIYVMVWGILLLLLMAMLFLPKALCPWQPLTAFWILCILSVMLLHTSWIIFGSYQIYSVYPPNYNKNLTNSSDISRNATDERLLLALDNQNRTLPSDDHTGTMNATFTLSEMIQSLVQSRSNQRVRESLTAPLAARYCDRLVYLFAFWTTTVIYVLAGVFLLITCCLYIGMKFVLLILGDIWS